MIRDFEPLIRGFEFMGVIDILKRMPPDNDVYVGAKEKRLADLDGFTRDYRSFAGAPNARIGPRVFGTSPYLPD